MGNREALSKQIRFEVFKRDKFTCQYCGQKAPDIVLQVDHIHPVALGGDNDIVNLVTSCFECNNGKRDRKLDDNSVVEKQRRQLEILQERREQIELMLEWKKSLSSFDNDVHGMVVEYINSKIQPLYLNDTGKNTVSDLLKKFKVDKILDGIDQTAKNYLKYDEGGVTKESAELFLNKIGGVIVVNDKPPIEQKLAYIRGIARNRFHYWDDRKGVPILRNYINACLQYGWSESQLLEDLEKEVIPLTKNSDNWSEWKNQMESWTNDILGWKNEEQDKKLIVSDASPLTDGNQDAYCCFCYSSEVLFTHSLNFEKAGVPHIATICEDCLRTEQESRLNNEKKILESLRSRRFSYSNISYIAYALEKMPPFHSANNMASVIGWALQDETIMKNLAKQFFDALADSNKNTSIDDLPF